MAHQFKSVQQADVYITEVLIIMNYKITKHEYKTVVSKGKSEDG